MFGIAIKLKPYDRGKAAFKKGVRSTKNPFPDHDPPRNDDDRWYLWRQGWRRAELDAVIAEKGTCAGEHASSDVCGKICDINGIGWVSLDPGTSAARLGWAPIQCTTCKEIWSMEMVGYTHETDMEAARNPELGHSFPKATRTCANCGLGDYPTITAPCINKTGDAALAKWLEARKELRAKSSEQEIARRGLEKAEMGLSKRPCPVCRGFATVGQACSVCLDEGTIGLKRGVGYMSEETRPCK